MKEIRLLDILKESKKYFFLDIIIWFFAHNIPILMAYLLKLYFDSNYKNSLYLQVGLYIILFILRIVLIKIGANVDIKAQHMWANSFYERITNKAYKQVSLKETKIRSLIDIIQNDINSIVGTISYGIDTFCNLFGIILAFIIMLSINIYISLVVMLIPIIIFFITKALKNKIYNKSNTIRENESYIINSYQEIIENLQQIRINSLEDKMLNLYLNLLGKNKKDKIKYGYFKSYISILNDFIVDFNIIIIFVGAIFFKITAGELSLFISYSFSINDLATYISSFTVIYSELGVYIDSFNKKMNDVIIENEENVDFNKIIDKIKPNTINVIIGENGSGKTKILKSISKSYKYPLVLKNSSVLSENLYENISLGEKSQNFDKIVDLFSLNDLKNRKKLSQKELSGGQIDRIAIARVLKFKNNVILIDNNLLSINEKIRKSILNYFEKSKSTFVITDQQDRKEYINYNKIFINL